MKNESWFPDPSQAPLFGAGTQRPVAREYAALASMTDAVYCVDMAGRFTFVNTAFEEMTGYSAAELRDTPSLHLYVPEAETQFQERRRHAYNGSTVSPYLETVMILKGGARLPVELSVSNLVINGQMAGRVGVVRDVTARLRLEEERMRERVDHSITELREAHALMSTLFATAPVGLGFWDRDLRYIRINEQLARINGIPLDAYKGKTPSDLLPGIENIHQLMADWRQVIATGKPMLNVELSGETPAEPGRQRHWLTHYFPVYMDASVIGIGAVIEEITAQKQAERALRESEARLRAVIETAVEGIITIDEHGRVDSINPAAMKLFGYESEEVVGRNVNMLMPNLSQSEHDSSMNHDLTTEMKKIIGCEREVVGQRKDGSTFPIELSVSETKLEDQLLFTGIVRDISQRRATEELLRIRARQQEAVAKLGELALRERDAQSVLERAAAMVAQTLEVEYSKVFKLLPSGDVLQLCAGVGWGEGLVGNATLSSELSGQAGYTLFADAPVIVKDLRQETRFSGPQVLIDHGVISGLSCVIRRLSGAPWGVLGAHSGRRVAFTQDDVNFLVSVANILSDVIQREHDERALQQANAELERRVIERTGDLLQAHDDLQREMDQRQRVQAALFQSEKLASLGALLANVAHELNNPLAIASMELENLGEMRGVVSRSDDLGLLRQAVDRCKGVVQSFLNLARQQTPTRQSVSINAIFDEALVLLEHAMEVDGILIERRLADNLPLLWGDPHQLHHVVANLIANAHHALRQRPLPRYLYLTTATDANRTEITLEVADNGPGMPEDVQRRVFDPFFTTKPQGEGSGLGLPLCRNIVEAHGGAIDMISQVGDGAKVRIALPVVAGDCPSPGAPWEPDASVQAEGGAAILLIDDEPGMQNALRRLLQRRGYDVTTANNGQEGLRALESSSYDVILCDVRMPDLDGPGFYHELERRYPRLLSRLIFLTGDVLSLESQAFFDQVDCPRLIKPFRADDIQRAVQQLLEAQ